jgi:DNA-binding GntR family transcriptional regulator
LDALEKGNPETAAQALRSHVAIQGEKFYRLAATLKAQTPEKR